MNTAPAPLSPSTLDAAYLLRFQSLFNEGRALMFPCDAAGHVDMDALSDRARHNYLYARTVIGREFGAPIVARALDRTAAAILADLQQPLQLGITAEVGMQPGRFQFRPL